MLTIAVASLCAALAGLLAAQVVAAHAGLAAASPGPDAVVGGEVRELQLFYGDFITTFEATVTSPSGVELEATTELASDIQGTVTLATALVEAGEYRVRHTITSIDTDVVDADYTFVYEPSAPAPQIVFVPDDEGGLAWWLWAILGVGAAVILVLAGRLIVAMRRARATS